MTTRKNTELDAFEQELKTDMTLPRKWRKHFVTVFKEQANQIEEPEEIRDFLDAWAWFRRPDEFMFLTLKYLAQSGANSAYFLANDYLFDQGVESKYTKRKDMQVLAARFRRSCHKLYRAGLIQGVSVKPEDVGPGRNSVTIWVSPFAKQKDIDICKKFYVELAEGRTMSAKDIKKPDKKLTLHNRKMKVQSILDKYKENPQFNDYFKCVKKHEEGLQSHKKIKSRYRRSLFVYKCKECDRDLLEIPFEEFIDLKKKHLYKKWDIKD